MASKYAFEELYQSIEPTNETIHHFVEGIEVRSHYVASEIEDLEHIGYGAGTPPFLRGPYASMYTAKPWTIRQYAGFSTAKKSYEFYL